MRSLAQSAATSRSGAAGLAAMRTTYPISPPIYIVLRMPAPAGGFMMGAVVLSAVLRPHRSP
jgi:hypothetical protein